MKRIILFLSSVLLIISSTVIVAFFGLFFYFKSNVDYSLDKELFEKSKSNIATYYYVYNENDELEEVWNTASGDRKDWISIDQVGEKIKNAFIAVEDNNFYKHKGINWGRTALATINYITKSKPRFGASTITQQVVKNISGDNENKITRKVNEIFRAAELEKSYSKDDILEMYLNIIPMPGNMYGIRSASNRYFGKEPNELNIAEVATIVGITNAPSKYNPYEYPDKCVKKRNIVLYAMYNNGVISDEEYRDSVNAELILTDDEDVKRFSSWFVETATSDVLSDLKSKYNLSEQAAQIRLRGAKIVMSMNKDIQDILENFFYNDQNLSDKFKSGLDYAMVISDPKTGDLLGIVGNGGEKKAEKIYNHATNPIIPGSVLKPLSIYAPLLDSNKIKWSDMVEDSPVRYTDENGLGYPKNSPDVYEGYIDINTALKKSKNTVAVKLYNLIGGDNIYSFLTNDLKLKGIYDIYKTDKGTYTDIAESPLALGQLSKGVSLRDITEAYNIFPSYGILPESRSYYCVFDSLGNTLLENRRNDKRVIKTETAEIMNQMLMNVVDSGTAKRISLKESVDTAGKTGTSSGDKDRLFIGFTPYITAGIWCGYSSEGRPIGDSTPGHLQIWDEIMKQIHNKCFIDYYGEAENFETSNVLLLPYCASSGCIPNDRCSENEIKYGYFTPDNIPNEECCIH